MRDFADVLRLLPQTVLQCHVDSTIVEARRDIIAAHWNSLCENSNTMAAKARAPLQRVHRNLSKPELEALRESVAAQAPNSHAQMNELIKAMRLSTKRAQPEYAALCGVSLRVLRNVESGKLNLQTETLEKLLKPFGYRIGIVRTRD